MKVNPTGILNYNPSDITSMDRAKCRANPSKTRLGNVGSDSAAFSAAGKKLNLLINNKDKFPVVSQSPNNIAVSVYSDDRDKLYAATYNEWHHLLGGIESKNLNAADKYMAKIGGLLEQMLEIAETATDSSMDDAERIELQIEIGRLQHELNIACETMAGNPVDGDYFAYERNVRSRMGEYEDTLAYKMLRRASERIASGEEWNVGEIMHNGPWVKNERGTVEGIDGIHEERPSGPLGYVINGVPGGDFRRLELLPWEHERGIVDIIYEVTDDSSVPTVGDILKSRGRSVMDAKSAEATAEGLKDDIEALKRQRTNLVQAASSPPDQSGANSETSLFLRQLHNAVLRFSRESYDQTVGRDLWRDGQVNYLSGKVVENNEFQSKEIPGGGIALNDKLFYG